MKNTLVLALALGVLAGCADESPDVIETDTTVIEPAAPVTEPTDDLMDEDMMMEDSLMMEGDAGLSEDDELMEEPMMEEGEMEVE